MWSCVLSGDASVGINIFCTLPLPTKTDSKVKSSWTGWSTTLLPPFSRFWTHFWTFLKVQYHLSNSCTICNNFRNFFFFPSLMQNIGMLLYGKAYIVPTLEPQKICNFANLESCETHNWSSAGQLRMKDSFLSGWLSRPGNHIPLIYIQLRHSCVFFTGVSCRSSVGLDYMGWPLLTPDRHPWFYCWLSFSLWFLPFCKNQKQDLQLWPDIELNLCNRVFPWYLKNLTSHLLSNCLGTYKILTVSRGFEQPLKKKR